MTRVRFWILLEALLLLEAGWLAWWLIVPLPNARNIGGNVLRGQLLLRALPDIVPGLTWRESHLGLTIHELSHWRNLPQRLPIVIAALFIAAAATSLGSLVLRSLGLNRCFHGREAIPLSFGVGNSLLGVLTLGAGRMGWLWPWSARVALLAIIVVATFTRIRLRRQPPAPARPAIAALRPTTVSGPAAMLAFVLVAGPFVLLMALGSMLPTIDFDALEYHLQGPKEYFQAGRISFLPHNVYTSMPFGVEMLHLLGMEVIGDWWRGALVGQFLVMLHAPMAAWLIYLAASRWGSPRAGWFAALVYLTTPWVFRLAAIPYVEGPLCFYHAALIYAAGRAIEVTSARSVGPEESRIGQEAQARWLLCGLLAGGAMACKYPALISAVLPFGAFAVFAAMRASSPRIACAFAIGVAIVIGPWLLKNVIDTRNPVYPLAWSVFGGRDWDAVREAKWVNAHGPRSVSLNSLVQSVIDVAGRSDWQSALFVALAPLAFLRLGSRRFATLLLGYAIVLFATWWLLTHRLDRFWIPILPPLAVLAGLGADWSRGWAWSVVLAIVMTVGVATNLVYVSTSLAGLNQWTDDLDKLRHEVPRMINAPLEQLDRTLPQGAKVLLVGQASVFHLRRPIVYNTVFDNEIIEAICRDRTPDEIHRELLRREIDYIYVDWAEIMRHRKPGGYGFTPFVTAELFDRLERAGLLEPQPPPGPDRSLFLVTPKRNG